MPCCSRWNTLYGTKVLEFQLKLNPCRNCDCKIWLLQLFESNWLNIKHHSLTPWKNIFGSKLSIPAPYKITRKINCNKTHCVNNRDFICTFLQREYIFQTDTVNKRYCSQTLSSWSNYYCFIVLLVVFDCQIRLFSLKTFHWNIQSLRLVRMFSNRIVSVFLWWIY